LQDLIHDQFPDTLTAPRNGLGGSANGKPITRKNNGISRDHRTASQTAADPTKSRFTTLSNGFTNAPEK